MVFSVAYLLTARKILSAFAFFRQQKFEFNCGQSTKFKWWVSFDAWSVQTSEP